MNAKIEKQLVKIKKLDAKMVETLDAMRTAKEASLDMKNEEIRLSNLATDIEREMGGEKEILFELLRNDK